MNHKVQAAGFVTAGGKSSRMGRDKAWLDLDGLPMIEHVIAALRPVAKSVSVIANDPAYHRLNLPVIADMNAGIGPLEAIRVALAASESPWTLLVGCDLPFVTPELLAYLLSRTQGVQAVVPLDPDGRLEPVCAAYSTLALPAVSDLIAAGERKIARLFDRIPAYFVPFSEMRDLTGAGLFFENINSPEDYESAVTRLSTPPNPINREKT
jgi:molybdopterin-guanine dinucleotide biosynthesis protein A